MAITGMAMSIAFIRELQIPAFWHYVILVLQFLTSRDVSVPGLPFRIERIIGWSHYHQTLLYLQIIYIKVAFSYEAGNPNSTFLEEPRSDE